MSAVASRERNEQIPFVMCHKEKDNFKVQPNLPDTSHAPHRLLTSSALKHRDMSPAFQSKTEYPLCQKIKKKKKGKPKLEEIKPLHSRPQKLFNYETHAVNQVLPKLLLGRADSAPAAPLPRGAG